MCGIVGHISSNGQIDPDLLKSMADTISHRGPDDAGVYISSNMLPSAGLAHRRLSIIDLSHAGHQPMCNEDGTKVIVFNGEIYNYHFLREELIERGHVFKSHTDTEVILHLYEDHGTDCLKFLRGMFAFALWDENERQLFLARDRLGKKPLYYANTGRGFYFASEITALYVVPHIKKELDYDALDHFLTFSYIPSPYSIFRAIRKLPPAHYLVLNNSGLRMEKYWKLEFSPKLDLSIEEAKSALLSKIEEATKIRLYSDVPLGCFLSGGVDSSTIVAIMSKFSEKPIKTFSIGFSEPEYDETNYARIVAKRYKTDHHEFLLTPNALEVLPQLVKHYGEPYGDSSALPTWYLSEMTRKYVTVALNGDGGDELFAGYPWHATFHMLNRLSRLLPNVLYAPFQPLIKTFKDVPFFNKILRLLELISLENPVRYAELRTMLKSECKIRLYDRYFLEQLENSSRNYITRCFDEANCEDDLERMLYTDIKTYLPDELLVKVDRATMAHSLEGRSPFLDHELVEFVARLPLSFKYRNGESKYILKETIKNYFPPNFFDRPKQGFSVPLKTWFCNELKTFAHDELCRGVFTSIPLFNTKEIENMLREHSSGKRNHDFHIWNMLVLSQWIKLYL